jgi:hypothetical protein
LKKAKEIRPKKPKPLNGRRRYGLKAKALKAFFSLNAKAAKRRPYRLKARDCQKNDFLEKRQTPRHADYPGDIGNTPFSISPSLLSFFGRPFL